MFRNRRSRAELDLARRRFALAFDEAAIGMALVAPDGAFIDANSSLCGLLERSRDELGRIGFQSVTHPDDLDADLEFVRQMLDGERQTYQMEKRYLRPDGSTIWGLLSVSLVRDDDGVPVHFISQIQDITARRQAEQELDRSTARFRAAFDESPIGMALIRTDGEYAGTIIEVNGQLNALAHVLGRPMPIIGLDELFGGASGVLFDELAGASDDADPLSYEVRLEGGDSERWVRVVAAPVGADGQGEGRFAIVQVSDITEGRRAQDELAHNSMHDSLTGLPNRILMTERVIQAQERTARSDRHLGVAFIDLDNFKEVNDSLGHAAGDQLLKQVADRFVHSLRPFDTAARIGGDEFVILCEELDTDPEVAARRMDDIARRLHDQLDEPIEIDGYSQWVSASIGTHVVSGTSESVDAVLSGADVAMYRAKQLGRSRTAHFDEHLRSEARNRGHISRELRHAEQRDQLHVAYQPIVSLPSREIVGAEALLRWDHPTLGSVRPDQFIAVAEESQVIVQLGEYVIRQVGHVLASGRFGQFVTINVSARQLARSDFAGGVLETLERLSIPASLVAVELTENVLMEAGGSSLRQLEDLKRRGVGVGVDDFGTGYASLTYLKKLPVTFVKIDKSFVADLASNAEDRVIVRAVLGLSASLGLFTIAEGIETDEQATILTDMGCELAQGYLFGRPGQIDDIGTEPSG